jgi:chemotaxis protein CheX
MGEKAKGVFDASLQSAIQKAFEVQASTAVKTRVQSEGDLAGRNADIAAILSLKSSRFSGSLGFSFPQATFLSLLERMLGERFTEINAEVADAAGELLNITYGIARPLVNNAGHDFEMAIPVVIRGQKIALNHAEGHSVFLEASTDVGPFWVELHLRANDGA